MSWLKRLYVHITDDPEIIGLENHLVILSCVLAIVALFIALIINIILPLGHYIVIITSVGLILYSVLFILARAGHHYKLTKGIYIITLCILIDLLWITNFGSMGPIFYIYIVAYTGFLFYLRGRPLFIFSIFFFFNTLGMFILEYLHPELLSYYPNEQTRLIDIYSGLLIYLTIATFLMIYIKTGYIRERDKALRSEKLKSAFLANISHEIRTPLNSILGYNQILMRSVDDDKLKAYMNTVDQNGQYLLYLIEDVLDISRIEAGDVMVSKSVLKIEDLFEDIRSLLVNHYMRFIPTEASLSYHIEPEGLVIFSDYLHIKQILLKFLTNALKYTPSGSISYKCMLRKDSVYFSVQDTGIGIDESGKPLIFHRFRKLEQDKRKERGTGIGLSIAKSLVEILGGTIGFTSVRYQGSEFFFSIPYENPDAKK